MKIALVALVAGTLLSGAGAWQTSGMPAPARVTLTRLDCGTVAANDLDQFSDTHAYAGQSKELVSSCYLIRHGAEAMLWDTGLPAALKNKPIDPAKPMDATVRTTLVEQLATLGLSPAQIGRVGVSHYHFDHVGQAASFPQATLFIGALDWAVLTGKGPAPSTGRPDAKPLAPWIAGPGKVEAVTGDRDVFGDGTVTMLDLPGHTPGHHGLLVRLKNAGNVLLTGDAAHFQQNYDTNGVPAFNTDRADSLASLERFKRLAQNLTARVIIQHDPADLAKLPAFPQAAD